MRHASLFTFPYIPLFGFSVDYTYSYSTGNLVEYGVCAGSSLYKPLSALFIIWLPLIQVWAVKDTLPFGKLSNWYRPYPGGVASRLSIIMLP